MASRDMRFAVQVLRDAVPKIIADYRLAFHDCNLIVISVSRTAAEQWELFKIGREIEKHPDGSWTVLKENAGEIVTKMDGYKKRSKHIILDGVHPLSEAVDFGVIVNGKYLGEAKDRHLYWPLRDLAHKYGLVHGSDFPGDFKDLPHIETVNPFYPPGYKRDA